MFRATVCPSSGEMTVSMRHLVLVTLYGWLSGMQGGMNTNQSHTTLHTRQSSIQIDNCQVSHRYSYFSWWWAHSRPKNIEKRNKHTKKNCAPTWLYLQGYTGMHGQQNIKFTQVDVGIFCLSMNIVLQQCVKRIHLVQNRGQVVGSWKHSSEPLGSVKFVEFLNKLTNK